jgi:hypothetical protein
VLSRFSLPRLNKVILILEMVTQKQLEIASSRLLMVKVVQGVEDLSTMLIKCSPKVGQS